MKPLLLLVALSVLPALLCALAVLPADAAPPTKPDFIVAANGDDSWSGTRAAPNKAKTDGPFATLERAREAVRHLRRPRILRVQPIVVAVRGGTYFLDKPLAFTPDDSGTAESPTVYEAYPNEKPVLSGGRPITGWRQAANGHWETTVPGVKGSAPGDPAYFGQLYVNGERRNRPRLPRKDGYFFVAGEVAPTEANTGKGFDRFRFRPGDIAANWHNTSDVEILAFHVWAMSRLPVKNVDEAARVVTLGGPTPGLEGYTSFKTGNRYLVENVREALGPVPGEWYLDRATGVLTYVPRTGETIEKTTFVAPRLPVLVEFTGYPDTRLFVQHVTLRGLTFSHNAFTLPATGYAVVQAEYAQPGAVRLVGARNCALENCRITNVATYAVELGQGTKRCRVTNCELTQIGAGGVRIGETARQDDEELVASDNTIENCLIAHGGRLHPAGIGVWIGQSHHNTIAHNDIADFYYSGISGGWTWGYGASNAHHNTYEFNRVGDLGQGVLSDMGGIYLLGVSPGTVVKNNVFHDVFSFDYGGWGIYFDEGSTGVVAENNLVYRTKTGGFHQHYGRDNVVRNNVFVSDRVAQIARTRREEHLSFTFERNLVYWKDTPLLRGDWSDNFVMDHNLYFEANKNSIRFGDKTRAAWQAAGHDKNSLVGVDPLFVNVAKDDFRLRPGSPAAKIGFVPFDVSRAGRRTKSNDLPLPPRAFPPPPPPAPPAPIADGFEESAVGSRAVGATTSEEAGTPAATIRVSEDTAATGKRSLKFSDAPGQKFSYNPHLFYQPGFTTGTLVGRFALRHETGALVLHEWRDNASPYNVGPSLRVTPDGTLYAGERRLAQLPPGAWVTLEITCALGPAAKGTWDLSLSQPGHAPERFAGLPCGPDFRALHWWGFIANSTTAAVFYLDDLSLAPRVAAREK